MTTQPVSASAVQPAADANACSCPLDQRETLTNNWLGLGKELSEKGLNINLSATQVYQQNLRGGLSTHRHAGRYSGRYDLEAVANLGKLANLPGGRVYALARGGWSEGITEPSVGSLFDVNGLEIGDVPIALWQLYYEQSLLDKRITVRVGKIDLTNCLECCGTGSWFDGNSFANDETNQFLNKSLINNPTIPFPAAGLGTMVHMMPVEGWYLAAAAADADAKATETGFNTTFHGPTDFFSIYETGFLPKIPSAKGTLPGGYRAGLWYDPQLVERPDDDGKERNRTGFYTSCDQMLWKENDKKDDTQGLSLFGRYGVAEASVNSVKSFWSTGLSYQGLIPTRDQDVLGFGVGQGRPSREVDFTRADETVLETFYLIQVTPWLHVDPDFQYIFNPGGNASARDAVAIGVRIGIVF